MNEHVEKAKQRIISEIEKRIQTPVEDVIYESVIKFKTIKSILSSLSISNSMTSSELILYNSCVYMLQDCEELLIYLSVVNGKEDLTHDIIKQVLGEDFEIKFQNEKQEIEIKDDEQQLEQEL